MNQNVNQILCICQHTWVEDNEVLRFLMISAKNFNVKNIIKSMFATVYNTYCIIHGKVQMVYLIDSQIFMIVWANTQKVSWTAYLSKIF